MMIDRNATITNETEKRIMAQMTPKEIAAALEVDPKVLRRFLRSVVPADAQPGKGRKWSINADAMPALTARFAAWSERSAKVVTIDDLAETVEPAIPVNLDKS